MTDTVDEKPPGTQSNDYDFPSVTKPEGYLFVDHRNSPGLTEAQARRMGYDPHLVKEGKVFEAATLACVHCPSSFIKNPLRTRDRGHCFQCNGYICDACVIASRSPDYIHVTRQEMIDKVTSGRFTLSGSMSLPILTRKETSDG